MSDKSQWDLLDKTDYLIQAKRLNLIVINK